MILLPATIQQTGINIGNLHAEKNRWRKFTHEEIIARDKTSLDRVTNLLFDSQIGTILK